MKPRPTKSAPRAKSAHPLRAAPQTTPAAGRLWLAAAALALATLIAYGPVYSAGFIWDDDDYVTENPQLRSLRGLGEIWTLYYEPQTQRLRAYTAQYYPLTFTSFWIEHQLWGLNATGYHVVNVVLHVANALLVWLVCRRLKIPAAWLIAAVFALHPVHVESVAWITERKNTLSGLFYLLALLAYLRFDQRGSWSTYAASLLLFVAALLSKTVTSTLPAVLLLILWVTQPRLSLRRVAPLAPMFVLGLASGLLTAYLEKAHVAATGVEWDHSLLERLLILIPSNFLFYARTILWPYPLMFVAPRWEVDPTHWPQYIPLALLLAVALSLLALRRRLGWTPLALLAFSAVTLLPALGLFDVYWFRYSHTADHFQYLGSLGFITLFVLAARSLTNRIRQKLRPHARAAAATAALAGLAVLTFRQSFAYENTRTLWETALRQNPHAWIAMINLGFEYEALGRNDEAAALYRRAQAYPFAAELASARLTTLLLRSGDASAAEFAAGFVRDLQAGRTPGIEPGTRDGAGELRTPPSDRQAAIFFEAAGTQLRAGQEEIALRSLTWAVKHAPENVTYRLARADLHARRGEHELAAADYAAALDRSPLHRAALRGLLDSALSAGRHADASVHAQAAWTALPDDEQLLWRLAWVMAASPDAAARTGPRALELARRLAKIETAENLDLLAAALAECGEFAQAAQTASRAADLAREQGNASLSGKILRRKARYERGEPARLE